MKEMTKSPETMKKLAEKIISQWTDKERKKEEGALVIGLYGELGSGKTVFAQGAAESLGVTEKVNSPTFVIEKIYKILHPHFTHLIHIDAYRLESEEELSALGWKDILSNERNIILIEWADRAEKLLPAAVRRIKFNLVGETLHEIVY